MLSERRGKGSTDVRNLDALPSTCALTLTGNQTSNPLGTGTGSAS